MEIEFKKVLTENNEKFRLLKISFQERIKNESELKSLLKVNYL
jgi:hypothetical protein